MFSWLRLLPFFDADSGAASGGSGVEGTPAAGEQQLETETQTGEQGAVAEPGKEDVAFSKRFSAAQEKWNADKEAEIQAIRDEYKDHDSYKKAAEYLQRTAGVPDLLTLREEIELAELQERAEKENVPLSVQKRIESLEAKAAVGEKLEAEQKQQQEWTEFETQLKTFVADKTIDGKPVDHAELWKYMHDNKVSSPEIALKAMKADILETKLETAKADAVKDYLASKQAPKIEGSQGAAAQTTPTRAGSIDAAEERALARLRAAREAQ